jgi:hypothetical protein
MMVSSTISRFKSDPGGRSRWSHSSSNPSRSRSTIWFGQATTQKHQPVRGRGPESPPEPGRLSVCLVTDAQAAVLKVQKTPLWAVNGKIKF